MVLQFLKASFAKVKQALSKTSSLLGGKLRALFSRQLDEETLEQLEQTLYEADLGVQTAREPTAKLGARHRKKALESSEACIEALKEELLQMIPPAPPLKGTTSQPEVILIVGVNGNGKTTATAKLAKRFQEAGKKVILGAADTFRAAAVEQLDFWANQLQIDIVKGHAKSDPSAVVFDTLNAAKSRGADVAILDTAGRLHTKSHLMQELEKIRRTCQTVVPGSPHEIWLVLDATTGQNGIDQAKTFSEYTPLTGLILTKIDGTAKGGVAINIQRELKIPIRFLGTGETLNDLEPFERETFVHSLSSLTVLST